MKLKSFKTVKLPAMVICMLAAGICYSCSSRQDFPGKEGMVLALENGDMVQSEVNGVPAGLDDGTGPETGNPDLVPGAEVPGTAPGAEVPGTAPGATDSGTVKPGTWDSDTAVSATGKPGTVISGTASPGGVFVHVCGKVMEPGVYELPEESRIRDAIEAAGGFLEEGARDYLNLAEKVQDGMKLDVPSESQAEEWRAQGLVTGYGTGVIYGGSPGKASGNTFSSNSRVNLNTASREELMSLRGIGESRAEDIIRYRETYGGFQSIEDIMNVSGIKDAAFEKIKDSITV